MFLGKFIGVTLTSPALVSKIDALVIIVLAYFSLCPQTARAFLLPVMEMNREVSG